MNIEFDSKHVYGNNDKYIKIKQSYGDKENSNFQGNKISKKASHKCLSLIMLVSVIRINKKYFWKNSNTQ